MNGMSIEKSVHSADKDHTIMAGGTLTADKTVRADDELYLHQSTLPVAPVTGDPAQYSGIHSVEHALAYSPATGSLRSSLEQLIGSDSANQLIDVSPYVLGITGHHPVIGFRTTYISTGVGLTRRVLAEGLRRSLTQMRVYYEGGGQAPFSTAEQCGQYNAHSPEAALGLIALALEQVEQGEILGGRRQRTDASELYVCDLRLVRPRAEGDFEQRVLDPLAGHLISQRIERDAAHFLPAAGRHTLKTGNFGCSTGEYVMLANPEGVDVATWLRLGHTAITRILMKIASQHGGSALDFQAAADAVFSLEHIQRASPDVYDAALQVSAQ